MIKIVVVAVRKVNKKIKIKGRMFNSTSDSISNLSETVESEFPVKDEDTLIYSFTSKHFCPKFTPMEKSEIRKMDMFSKFVLATENSFGVDYFITKLEKKVTRAEWLVVNNKIKIIRI